MKRKELIKKIKELHLKDIYYGFGNICFDDVIRVGKNSNNMWEVFYSERGKKKVYFETADESTAYEYLYNYLKKYKD